MQGNSQFPSGTAYPSLKCLIYSKDIENSPISIFYDPDFSKQLNLLLRMILLNQQHRHYVGTYRECGILGPSPELLASISVCLLKLIMPGTSWSLSVDKFNISLQQWNFSNCLITTPINCMLVTLDLSVYFFMISIFVYFIFCITLVYLIFPVINLSLNSNTSFNSTSEL